MSCYFGVLLLIAIFAFGLREFLRAKPDDHDHPWRDL